MIPLHPGPLLVGFAMTWRVRTRVPLPPDFVEGSGHPPKPVHCDSWHPLHERDCELGPEHDAPPPRRLTATPLDRVWVPAVLLPLTASKVEVHPLYPLHPPHWQFRLPDPPWAATDTARAAKINTTVEVFIVLFSIRF